VMLPTLEQHEPRIFHESLEEQFLSRYAARSIDTRGREVSEPHCQLRTVYQVDRDRIIHCKAFRRLKHKTQVFISPVSEHYRTRMTHTIEVTNVSRTIARALRLNEDLTEAIGMGHDLGHPPFGHNGEGALSDLYHGGFWHNRQSVRVAKTIEKLNLTHETLDGLAKHTGKDNPETLEGQVVKTADRMAYLAHDIEDAIRAGLMANDSIPREISEVLGYTKEERLQRMMWGMISASWDQPAIAVQPEISEAMHALRKWMFRNVYLTPRQKEQAKNVKRIVGALYDYYKAHPEEISPSIPNDIDPERRVVDYIAGMTDRYATNLYCKLFLPIPYEPGQELPV
jgi:dGTPase